jgi:hypothetical protein
MAAAEMDPNAGFHSKAPSRDSDHDAARVSDMFASMRLAQELALEKLKEETVRAVAADCSCMIMNSRYDHHDHELELKIHLWMKHSYERTNTATAG